MRLGKPGAIQTDDNIGGPAVFVDENHNAISLSDGILNVPIQSDFTAAVRLKTTHYPGDNFQILVSLAESCLPLSSQVPSLSK